MMMGCTKSRLPVENASRPVFHVWNIDDHGQYIKSCHIQVTDTDLVLYQRGESPILWPLQSLKRYGFDSELFSFECGRKCTTGPGIFAFKCKKAESLFNALQECLQLFSESELGLSSSVNGADINGSTITNGNVEELTDQTSNITLDDTIGPHAFFEYGVDAQPSTSTGIKKVDERGITGRDLVAPTAPAETISTVSSPSTIDRRSHVKKPITTVPRLSRDYPIPYQKSYDYATRSLPRCCTIGTCISSSNQHYMNPKALRNTTCGSCRTCSLNMCVVRPSVNNSFAPDYEERTRQADYGNVLDPGGRPRQCVHCCCSFKPRKQMSSCSADNCPLHFNNCVDQITSYTRIDEHLKRQNSADKLLELKLRKKRMSMHQPVHFASYAHLYTNIPSPTKKWPFSEKSKSASWRSLPHFRQMSYVSKLEPKRSVSHFYSNGDTSLPSRDLKSALHKKILKKFGHAKSGFEKKVKLDTEAPLHIDDQDSTSSSPMKSDGYSAIDFEKTAALSKSTSKISIDSCEKINHGASFSPASSST